MMMMISVMAILIMRKPIIIPSRRHLYLRHDKANNDGDDDVILVGRGKNNVWPVFCLDE